MYAAIGAGIHDPGTQPVYKGYYIIRSDNKGVTWTTVNTPDGTGEWAYLAWHAMALAVDPNNPDILYAGGLDLWRTTDNGTNWDHLTDWTQMYSGGGTDYVHGDQHAIVYKPGSSNQIVFGCDGGVFYTQNGSDGTQTIVFQERNKNYNTLQFYSGAIHPTAGVKKYIGGLQDNGSLLYSGAPLTINNMISGGDGAFCFWDTDNPEVYITSLYYNLYYLFKYDTYLNNAGSYESGVFINPADYYSQSNTLFANGTDFWGGMSDSLMVIMDIPDNPNTYFVQAGTGSNSYFSHVKVSPFSTVGDATLFLGTVSGQLYKVKHADGIPVSTEIGSTQFPASNISSIAVGGSEDTLLVTFSNYGVSSIWQTYNGGQSWDEKEGNLPDMPVRWAIYHPKNSRQGMIATELGVWTTNNLNQSNVTWTPQTSGMANVRVDMLTLRKSDNTVLAASHGRGLFTCTFGLDFNISTHDNPIAGNPITLFVSETGINIQSATNQPANVRMYDMSGSNVFSRTVSGGNNTINTSQFANGVYLVEIKSGKYSLVKKVVI